MACILQASGIHFMYSARILGYSGSGGCTVSWQNLYTAPKTAMSPACQHLSSSLDLKEHGACSKGALLKWAAAACCGSYTIPAMHTLLQKEALQVTQTRSS